MILVGLTGGIGSGKTTVAALLAAKGAVIVDADAIVRELQGPGMPVVAAIAARFGDDVAPGGVLDRAALAGRVFADPDAVRALNAIVHPAVQAEMAARVRAERGTDHVVVLDIPLLAEGERRLDLQATIVVDVPTEVQVDRLVRQRGFDEADARARIARQATREARLALATHVIDNIGDLDDLRRQVDAVWPELVALAPFVGDVGERS
jgi:dephospho-CoA kinase